MTTELPPLADGHLRYTHATSVDPQIIFATGLFSEGEISTTSFPAADNHAVLTLRRENTAGIDPKFQGLPFIIFDVPYALTHAFDRVDELAVMMDPLRAEAKAAGNTVPGLNLLIPTSFIVGTLEPNGEFKANPNSEPVLAKQLAVDMKERLDDYRTTRNWDFAPPIAPQAEDFAPIADPDRPSGAKSLSSKLELVW